MIEMTIPSSLDPTLAPEGHHVVLLFTQYTPYNLAEGKTWTDEERNKYADTGLFVSMNQCVLYRYLKDIVPKMENEYEKKKKVNSDISFKIKATCFNIA